MLKSPLEYHHKNIPHTHELTLTALYFSRVCMRGIHSPLPSNPASACSLTSNRRTAGSGRHPRRTAAPIRMALGKDYTRAAAPSTPLTQAQAATSSDQPPPPSGSTGEFDPAPRNTTGEAIVDTYGPTLSGEHKWLGAAVGRQLESVFRSGVQAFRRLGFRV